MDIDEVLKKYSRQIEQEIGNPAYKGTSEESVTSDYLEFKQALMPELSNYEKWAGSLGRIIRLRLSRKDDAEIGKHLERAHLSVTPSEAVGLSIISFIFLFFFGVLTCVGIWFLGGGADFTTFPFLLLFLIVVSSFFIAYYLYSMPQRLAVKWRLKASSQMVPAILYTVIYMKHTSNLERAISFVSKHVEAPLALDFKKVLWDVETAKFSSIKQSMDNYLEFWKDTNVEFVESFHLIESSLFEPNDARRIIILERALKVILDEVYEKMLKYVHEIKSPLTNIYMMGIVLPTLGLALLPLASAMLNGMIKSTHVFVLFNLLIPFFVFYMTLQVMLNRPGGYGEETILEKNPLYHKYVSKKPYVIAALIAIPFLIIGFLPFIFQMQWFTDFTGLKSDYALQDLGINFLGNGKLFDFAYTGKSITAGPFGVVALLLSLFIPFSVAIFFAIAFKMKTKELIIARNKTKNLENEFNSTLFTLGNRLGDGIPPEIAFTKIAVATKGQITADFFRIVSVNIQSMGMSVEEAIFNNQRGAIIYYPSNLIATSMRILIESVKKGLNVAAESLMSISEYVRNIQKINERLRDLLAEVVSDMKSNMTFLAPLLSGIVIGLASMITSILSQLTIMANIGGADTSIAGFGNLSAIIKMIGDVNNMIPPYFMQIAIGAYIIEIIFILTGTLVTIDAGEDKLKRTNDIANNLIRGGLLYLIVAAVSIIGLAGLAGIAFGSLLGGA